MKRRGRMEQDMQTSFRQIHDEGKAEAEGKAFPPLTLVTFAGVAKVWGEKIGISTCWKAGSNRKFTTTPNFEKVVGY